MSAVGYASKEAKFNLLQLIGGDAAQVVELDRVDPLVPLCELELRAAWADGADFEGALELRLRRQDVRKNLDDTDTVDVQGLFSAGRARSRIRLPQGRYSIEARGPSATSGRAVLAAATMHEIAATSGPVEVRIALRGGRLPLKPRSAAGLPLQRFSYSVRAGGRHWLGTAPLEEAENPSTAPLTLILPPGIAHVRVGKEGFEYVGEEFVVDADGSERVWEPRLRPVTR